MLEALCVAARALVIAYAVGFPIVFALAYVYRSRRPADCPLIPAGRYALESALIWPVAAPLLLFQLPRFREDALV